MISCCSGFALTPTATVGATDNGATEIIKEGALRTGVVIVSSGVQGGGDHKIEV